MSIPGSGADRDAAGRLGLAPEGVPSAPLTPDTAAPGGAKATPKDARPARPKRRGIFRWKGIFPLLLGVALLVALYMLFADRVAQETLAEASTKALGTEVDIGALRILESETTLELDRIEIADPFDPMRNLLEVGGLRIELEPDPLLEKKAVIRRLTISKVRAGTRRRVAAKPVKGGGFAPQAMRVVQQWRKQFNVPKLKLAQLDTVKKLVLDPRQLGTVKVALALRQRADSTKDAIETELHALRIKETLDSTRATAERIAKIDPKTLGIAGARQAVLDVRRSLDTLRAVKARLEALQANTKAGVASLREGVAGLDSARRADYAFARGLLQLPTFEAPEIGSAIFGDVTIDRFQRLLYYSKLAEGYVPPGLRPKQSPGPERLRMSGTTVRFAALQSYPDFLLRRGDVDFVLEGNAFTSGSYKLAIANATTQPALVGKPMQFALVRSGGRSAAKLEVRGASDRRGAPVDVVKANLGALPLPSFALPGLPFRMDLNTGASQLDFERRGNAIAGRWTVRADHVKWQADSARIRSGNYLEKLVYRVIGGLDHMDIEANIGGTIAAPQLSVRSTLDREIAAQIRAVLGEEVARAEAFARAKVDSVVRDKEAEARVRVEALRQQGEAKVAEAQARLDEERARLDTERAKLEERLKKATGGVLGLPALPQIPNAKLPSIPKLPAPKGSTTPADTAAKPDSTKS